MLVLKNRMDKPEIFNFNSQSPTVNGFLGGITFTALILLIQSPHTFKFIHILIPLTAGVSFSFILAILGTSMDGNVHRSFFRLNVGFITLGLFGIMLIIPIMVYSFSLYGSIAVGMFEIIAMAFQVHYGIKKSTST